MGSIIDNAIRYCNSITCDKCPRRNKVCIMSYNGSPMINYFTDTTYDDLHDMIEFYRNLHVKSY